MKLTRQHEEIIKHLPLLKIISVCAALLGLWGLIFVIYANFFLAISQEAKRLNFTIAGLSIGIVIFSCLLKQSYNIIDSLLDKQ